MRPITVIFIVVMLLLRGNDVFAENLSGPLALESEGRLNEALTAFEEALAAPGNERADLATIHLHLGILRFAVGDRSGALESLVSLLAVEQEVSLPGTAPPEVDALLSQARERWAGRRLRAEIEADGQVAEGAQAVVHVEVIDDVASMVDGASLLFETEEIAEIRGSGPFDIVVPQSAFVNGVARISVRLIDEHGGELWAGDSLSLRRIVHSEAPSRPTSSNETNLRIAGWVLLAAGVLTLSGGAVLVGVDSRPTGETQELSDGNYLEEQLDTAVGGWLLVSTGSAALIAAVVLLLIRPRVTGGEEASLRLARGVVAQW